MDTNDRFKAKAIPIEHRRITIDDINHHLQIKEYLSETELRVCAKTADRARTFGRVVCSDICPSAF